MLSARRGVAVAASLSDAKGFALLARTTDGAKTWTVVSRLPAALGNGRSYDGGIDLSFVSPSIGYVAKPVGFETVPTGATIFVTGNGGRSWSRVAVPGLAPMMVVSGGSLWVTSSRCPKGASVTNPARCPSVLSRYALGATAPSMTVSIPRWPGTTIFEMKPLAVVPGASGPELLIAPTVPQAPGLWVWRISQRSWSHLASPCQNRGPVLQVLSQIPSRWLLYCFQGGGMNQGDSELWATTTRGTSWKAVAKANQMTSPPGGIGDVFNTLTYSEDRRLIWGELGGAAGGLEYSENGGSRWTTVNLGLNVYGGAPEFLSTAGPRGAIFGVVGGPTWSSVDGVSFRPVAGLR
jgi:hypothetical protein